MSDSHRRCACARPLCRRLPWMLGQPEMKLFAVPSVCPGPPRHEHKVCLLRHATNHLGVSRRCRPDPFCASGRRFHWVSLRDVRWCFALSSHQALVVTRDARRCLRLRSHWTGTPARPCTASFGCGDRRAAVEHHGDTAGAGCEQRAHRHPGGSHALRRKSTPCVYW